MGAAIFTLTVKSSMVQAPAMPHNCSAACWFLMTGSLLSASITLTIVSALNVRPLWNFTFDRSLNS